MANTDAPQGLTPIKHRNGAPFTGPGQPYYIPSTYATALYVGEAVVKTGTSNTAKVTVPGLGEFAIGTMPEINKTAAGDGNASTGVIVSFAANPDDLSKQYSPASTEAVAFVCDDPDVTFQIQGGSNAALAATDVGLNANLVDTHSGSTVTGRAGTEMDTGESDGPGATATNQLTIQRAINRTDNDATLVNADWEVKINNHTESASIVGI